MTAPPHTAKDTVRRFSTSGSIGRARMSRRTLVASVVAAALLWPGAAPAQPSVRIERSRPAPESGPSEVTVSIFVVDLFDVVSADQTIHADVAVVSQWHDPRLAGAWPTTRVLALDEVWHPRLQVVNQRQLVRSMGEDVEVQPDGTVTHRQRMTGTFTVSLDLRDFPRDRQTFQVHVVAAGYTPQEVRLLPAEEMSGRADRLSVSDWTVEPARLEPADLSLSPAGRTLPGIALVMGATRDTGYFTVQLLLPLLAIVMMSWTVFWVDPTVIPTRMSVVVTTMLTLIAYRFMVGSLVPKLSYLTRLDYFLLGATVLVLVALLAVSATSYLVARERRVVVDRIDRLSRLLFPGALAVLVTLVWLL